MMHNRHPAKLKLSALIIASAFALVLVGLSTLFVINRDSSRTTQNNTLVSTFDFDADAAPGWRKGPGNDSSIVLFKNDHDCFISIHEESGAIDENTRRSNLKYSLQDQGYTVTSGAANPVTLQTQTGEQRYQLYQYTVTGQGTSEKLYEGQALGYVPLSDGNLAIEAYCNPGNLLPEVMPALEAVTFNASK